MTADLILLLLLVLYAVIIVLNIDTWLRNRRLSREVREKLDELEQSHGAVTR